MLIIISVSPKLPGFHKYEGNPIKLSRTPSSIPYNLPYIRLGAIHIGRPQKGGGSGKSKADKCGQERREGSIDKEDGRSKIKIYH